MKQSIDQKNRTSSLLLTAGAISVMKFTGLQPCKWLRISSSIARKTSKVRPLTNVSSNDTVVESPVNRTMNLELAEHKGRIFGS